MPTYRTLVIPLLGLMALALAQEGSALADFDQPTPSLPNPPPPLDGRVPPPFMTEHADEIRGCYEPALQRHPNLEVHSTLTVAVNKDGAVLEATLPIREDAALEDCLEAAARTWRWPPAPSPLPGQPPPPDVLRLNFPFELVPPRS